MKNQKGKEKRGKEALFLSNRKIRRKKRKGTFIQKQKEGKKKKGCLRFIYLVFNEGYTKRKKEEE